MREKTQFLANEHKRKNVELQNALIQKGIPEINSPVRK